MDLEWSDQKNRQVSKLIADETRGAAVAYFLDLNDFGFLSGQYATATTSYAKGRSLACASVSYELR